MTLYLSPHFPAFAELVREGCNVRPAEQAGANAYRVLSVNNMSKESKTATDVQLGRLLAASPYSVHLTPVVPEGYVSKDGKPVLHYPYFSEVEQQSFDAGIVTGAPLEDIPLEDNHIWPSLQKIYGWLDKNVSDSLFICWAAQMALYHYHDVDYHRTDKKLFGIYAQELLQPPRSDFAKSLALHLAGTSLNWPVSRSCYADRHDIHRKAPDIDIILDSGETHPGLLFEKGNHKKSNRIYSFNHPEYNGNTLEREYIRDYLAGNKPDLPRNYIIPGIDPDTKWYPDDGAQNWLSSIPDPPSPPWRPSGQVIVNHLLREVARSRNNYDI